MLSKICLQFYCNYSTILILPFPYQVRWAESMDGLEGKLQGVVGDTLVAASSIAYLGVFTASYRRGMVNKWVEMCQSREIPLSHDFSLINSMAEPNTVSDDEIYMTFENKKVIVSV